MEMRIYFCIFNGTVLLVSFCKYIVRIEYAKIVQNTFVCFNWVIPPHTSNQRISDQRQLNLISNNKFKPHIIQFSDESNFKQICAQ